MNLLSGLTRKVFGGRKPVSNPGHHNPARMQNRIQVEVVGPDGKVKEYHDITGNIMATYGLNNIAELIATGGEASSWCSAGAIGTSTTAASSTQTGLVASTGIVHVSQSSMDASDAGDRTLRYVMTFASNNPAGAAAINEVGIFGTNNATTRMLARSVLGTASVNKGASDTINCSYDIVFTTA